MTISRRAVLQVGAGLAGAGALAGCGALGSQLRLYSSLGGSKVPAATGLTNAYKKKYPHVHFDYELIADPVQNNIKVLTGIAGANPPDLACNHYYYGTNYAASGQLEALGPDMRRAGLRVNDIDPIMLTSGRWQGTVYSLPLYGTSKGLMINVKMARAAGLDPDRPPRTWTDLREWSRRLTVRKSGKLKVTGLEMDAPPIEYGTNLFALLLWGAGGDFLTADKRRVAFNSAAAVRALNFWRQLLLKDKVYEQGFGAVGGVDPFAGEVAAMIAGSNYNAQVATVAGVDYVVTPFPTERPGGIALSDPMSLFIFAKAKHRDYAWDFVRLAMSYDQQVEFCLASSNLPALLRAQHDSRIRKSKSIAPFLKTISRAKPLPVIPQYTQLWDALSRAVEAAVTGHAAPGKALAEAEATVNRALAA